MSSGLAAWLRERSDAELAALLIERPDLATPGPPDLGVLAARAVVRVSLIRALEKLDRFELEVLDALRLISADRAEGASTSAVAGLLGVAPARVATAADRLRALALVTADAGDDATLLPLPALADLLGERIGGLGRPLFRCLDSYPTSALEILANSLGVRVVTPVGDVRLRSELALVVGEAVIAGATAAALAQLPEDERAVLDRLAATGPLGALGVDVVVVPLADADTAVRRLLARGLLAAVDAGTVELPREIGEALRGGLPLGPAHPDPPPYEGTDVGTAAADSAGAGQAAETVRLAATMLETWTDDPPSALRAGGLGVRDLRQLSRLLGVDERVAALLVEVVFAAGLLDTTTDPDPGWAPTAAYDTWLAHEPAARWVALVRGWLATGRLPGLVGERDDRDRPLPALGPDLLRPGAAEARAETLDVLAGAGIGLAADVDSLLARLAYRAPRRSGPGRERTARWALEEAATLGVTGRGALTGFGRGVLAGEDERAAQLLAGLLPQPVDQVLLQPDLTAVAPGPLVPEVARELALVADVESSGPATVYRIGETSVRRALDAGRTADELQDFFTRHSRTPVPQALTYLVASVAQRHGQMRVGAVGSYLRAEDPDLLAEAAAHRRTQGLGLRRLAPTVYVSREPVSAVLEALRAAGYAPAAESAAGGAVVARREVRRAATRPRPHRSSYRVTGEQADRLVRHLREGERLRTSARGDDASRSTQAMQSLLSEAVRNRTQIWLGYLDQAGRQSERVVQPTSLDGGFLSAYDAAADVTRTFALYRITGVGPVLTEG